MARPTNAQTIGVLPITLQDAGARKLPSRDVRFQIPTAGTCNGRGIGAHKRGNLLFSSTTCAVCPMPLLFLKFRAHHNKFRIAGLLWFYKNWTSKVNLLNDFNRQSNLSLKAENVPNAVHPNPFPHVTISLTNV